SRLSEAESGTDRRRSEGRGAPNGAGLSPLPPSFHALVSRGGTCIMALRYGEKRNICTKGSAVHDQRGHIRQRVVFLVSLCVLVTAVAHGRAADILASNKQPLAFGPGQTLIDLKKIVWEPLTGEGIPPGAKIATLRGDLAKGGGELLVYLPPNYTFPNH